MQHGADTHRRIVEFARRFFRHRNQVIDVLHGGIRLDDHRERITHRIADERKVANRIEGQLFHHCRLRGHRAAHQQQGVAIGRGLGHIVGTNHAARTGPVFHDDLLAQTFSQLLRHRTRDDVGVTARRKTGDDAQRTRGVILLRPQRHCHHAQQRCGSNTLPFHA